MNYLLNLNVLFKDFIDLIYPRLCFNCQSAISQSEEVICVSCKSSLPVADYQSKFENNLLKFVDINPEYVFHYLIYRKGNITQNLLYSFKYEGYLQIGQTLGRWFGASIKENINNPGIDLIVPVPLHEQKKRQRGFNQSEILALAMSEILNIPLRNALNRKKESKTQTRKSKTERVFNVKDLFQVKRTNDVEGKHILLVDDVITTGSTIASCALELLENGASKVSIASLAIAK